MRGPTLDARLEAIAGKPVLDVDGEATLPRAADRRFAVIVAGPPDTADNEPPLFFIDSPRVSFFLRNGTERVQGAGDVMRMFERGGMWCGVVSIPPPDGGSPNFAVGRRGQARWGGPMRALVYDTILTDFQIQRVIQHLMRDLKQQT